MSEKNKEIKKKCECGGRYTYFNKSHHKKTKKHLIYINNIINKIPILGQLILE